MRRRAACLIALLWPAVAAATIDLADNTWQRMDNGSTPPIAARGLTYSGFAVDTTHGKLLFNGGGHQDGYNDGVQEWDPVTRAWREQYTPDASAAAVDPLNWDAAGQAACLAHVDNTNYPGMWDPPNGRPIARHSGQAVEWLANVGRLTTGGGATAGDAGVWIGTGPIPCYYNTPGDFWLYDPVQTTWTYKSAIAKAGHPADMPGAGVSGLYYMSDSGKAIAPTTDWGVRIYDPVTDTWSNPGAVAAPPAASYVAYSYDSSRGRMVVVLRPADNSIQTWAYTVATNTWANLSPSTSPDAWYPAFYADGFVYDSINDVHLLRRSVAADCWKYDPVTNAWSTLATPPATYGTDPMGGLRFDPVNNVAWLAKAGPSGALGYPEIWAYRYKNNPTITTLTVQEALPSGVSGMARTNEPVTVGIPLAENSGITDTSTLSLYGADAGQFRVLGRWSNGNVKWVLVDTIASVDAGGTASINLTTDGVGNFGGLDLATDGGSTITVSTGAATFIVKKANFNVLNLVVVGATTLVTSLSGGALLAYDPSDTVYSSANDASSTAVIEENGPVRAVVKATGAFKSAGGTRLMDYTLRMHFYKGRSNVKMVYALRNSNPVHADSVVFHAAELVLPMTLGATKSVELARKTDTVTRSLASGDTAYIEHMLSSDRTVYSWNNCWDWSPPNPGACTYVNGSLTYVPDTAGKGVETKVGLETINAFGDVTDYSQGYGELRDSSGSGVTAAIRWMSSYYPAEIEFKGNGTATLGMYSKRNPKTQLKYPFTKRESREFMLDFHTSALADNKSVLYELQYPLLARAPASYYAATGAVFGQREFVTVAEQDQYFTNVVPAQWKYLTPRLSDNLAFGFVFRSYNWENGGAQNQVNQPLARLLTWLNGGGAGYYLMGENWTKFNNTQIYFTDGWDILDSPVSYIDSNTGVGATIGGFYSSNAREHTNLSSTPFYYLLSGDEDSKEAWLTYGRMAKAAGYGGFISYFRLYIHPLRNVALAYDLSCQVGSCDSDLAEFLQTELDLLLDSRANPADPAVCGWDMNRGFFYGDSDMLYYYPGQRVSHTLFLNQIFFEALWQVYRVNVETGLNYRTLDIEDRLTALSRFTWDEEWQEANPSSLLGAGIDYNFFLDEPYVNPAEIYATDFGRSAVWHFVHTGEESALVKNDKTLWRYITQGSDSHLAQDLQDQQYIWTSSHRTQTYTWKSLTPTFQSNGGGSYTLSWTVPTGGAARYQIKYHTTKQIVDWLGYDKATQTYAYSPTTYAPFFAATNAPNMPTPQDPGDAETYTITGLPAGLTSANFAMKYLEGLPWFREPADTTPPTVTNLLPAGELVCQPGVRPMTVHTSENATCREGPEDVEYALLPNLFSVTGGTSHSTESPDLVCGQSYDRCVRCRDAAGNVSTDTCPNLSFSMAEAAAPSGRAFLPSVGSARGWIRSGDKQFVRTP